MLAAFKAFTLTSTAFTKLSSWFFFASNCFELSSPFSTLAPPYQGTINIMVGVPLTSHRRPTLYAACTRPCRSIPAVRAVQCKPTALLKQRVLPSAQSTRQSRFRGRVAETVGPLTEELGPAPEGVDIDAPYPLKQVLPSE